jgi:hypothetical protein
MAEIIINGISLDPVAQAQALAAAGVVSPDASRSNYILIQAAAPLTDDQKVELGARRVAVHEYIAENTYLCSYKSPDLAGIRALSFVVWADVYLRGFKIAPTLWQPPARPTARFRFPPMSRNLMSGTVHNVDIVLHRDVDPNSDQLKRRVAAAAHLDPANLQIGQHKYRAMVADSFLEDLAAIDEVRHVEEVPPVELCNNVARGIIDADVVVNNISYKGEGQLIAIADKGFDTGDPNNVHPAFTGRVVRLYALGRTNPPQADDPDLGPAPSHGTHVSGSALGDGFSFTMGGPIQGTAPRARLVLQSLLDPQGGLKVPADLHDLFQPPYQNEGARVHTNSWGAFPGFPYGASSQEIDDFVWNNQDMVICFAASNAGTDFDGDGVVELGSISQQAAAKNCITVGASESRRLNIELTYGDPGAFDQNFPADPIHSDRIADNPDGMAAFSSRGPTQEGRYKPDVVAPGTCILSTLSRHVATAPTTFGISTDTAFFFDAGTSMATPLVAGCAAVLRETLVKNGFTNPSAALIKALLINGAVVLTGQYNPTEAGPSPNNNSGWGRVDLAGSVIIPGPNANGGCGQGGPLSQGQKDTHTVNIPAGGPGAQSADAGGAGADPTFKVTIVWTDPPGHSLQNDLDLIVIASDGTQRHGNMGTSKSFDRLNNVEQVFWENIPAGKTTFIVLASRITQFPQPYAWVWRIS